MQTCVRRRQGAAAWRLRGGRGRRRGAQHHKHTQTHSRTHTLPLPPPPPPQARTGKGRVGAQHRIVDHGGMVGHPDAASGGDGARTVVLDDACGTVAGAVRGGAVGAQQARYRQQLGRGGKGGGAAGEMGGGRRPLQLRAAAVEPTAQRAGHYTVPPPAVPYRLTRPRHHEHLAQELDEGSLRPPPALGVALQGQRQQAGERVGVGWGAAGRRGNCE